MDAFLYLRVRPGKVPAALSALSALPSVRQAALCVGDWDVLARVDGPDLQTIASGVLADVHTIDGIVRTYTAPVVPADRIGIGGFGGLTAPPVTANACYVHIQASPGAATGVAERLAESPDVAGVAVVGGHYDLIV